MTARGALLDTNILVSAPLRDLMVRLDVKGLIEVYISEPILEELGRAMRKFPRPNLTEDQCQRLDAWLREHFAGKLAEVDSELVDRITLTDPDDRHVVAAAYELGSVIVTRNLRDFRPEQLAAWNLEALSPDAFQTRFARAGYRDGGTLFDPCVR